MPSFASLPPVDGVSHRLVQVGDVRLHVAEAGDPQREPLLLLHGWPQHWWSWRELIPPLAKRFHILAPDLRGWGWSDAPPGRYDKPTFAADIVALLDAEGIDRVKLLGHDWGGYTSFLLALAHPERIERMVTLDIVPPWPTRLKRSHARLPAFLSYQLTVGMPGLGPRTMTRGPGFIRALIRRASGPEMRWSDGELDTYANVLREPARARASSACYRTFLTREVPRSLIERTRPDMLAVPTRLIMGGASFLKRTFEPEPSRNLEVTSIARAGHFLPEEAPAEVLEQALSFLT